MPKRVLPIAIARASNSSEYTVHSDVSEISRHSGRQGLAPAVPVEVGPAVGLPEAGGYGRYDGFERFYPTGERASTQKVDMPPFSGTPGTSIPWPRGMHYVARSVGVEDVFVSRAPVHTPLGDLGMDPYQELTALCLSNTRKHGLFL